MQLSSRGTLVSTGQADQQRLDLFLDKLAQNLYGRLPRFARMFLSQEALRALLGAAASSLISNF